MKLRTFGTADTAFRQLLYFSSRILRYYLPVNISTAKLVLKNDKPLCRTAYQSLYESSFTGTQKT